MSKNGRIIYDVLETASILNNKGFLVTVDIEKAFDFFFICCFTKVWFWVAFSKNQKSRIINGGMTTKILLSR